MAWLHIALIFLSFLIWTVERHWTVVAIRSTTSASLLKLVIWSSHEGVRRWFTTFTHCWSIHIEFVRCLGFIRSHLNFHHKCVYHHDSLPLFKKNSCHDLFKLATTVVTLRQFSQVRFQWQQLHMDLNSSNTALFSTSWNRVTALLDWLIETNKRRGCRRTKSRMRTKRKKN